MTEQTPHAAALAASRAMKNARAAARITRDNRKVERFVNSGVGRRLDKVA